MIGFDGRFSRHWGRNPGEEAGPVGATVALLPPIPGRSPLSGPSGERGTLTRELEPIAGCHLPGSPADTSLRRPVRTSYTKPRTWSRWGRNGLSRIRAID